MWIVKLRLVFRSRTTGRLSRITIRTAFTREANDRSLEPDHPWRQHAAASSRHGAHAARRAAEAGAMVSRSTAPTAIWCTSFSRRTPTGALTNMVAPWKTGRALPSNSSARSRHARDFIPNGPNGLRHGGDFGAMTFRAFRHRMAQDIGRMQICPLMLPRATDGRSPKMCQIDTI